MQGVLLVLTAALWLDGSMHAPRITRKIAAEYTREARDARYEGSVLVDVIVGADGAVKATAVRRSVGLGLGEKALEAISQWRFAPARYKKDNTPVEVKITISVDFRLE